MKKIAVIPARYAASRFPAKLMQDLGGKPVIVQTFLATLGTQLFDEVYVVTDSPEIFSAITAEQGNAILSTQEHPSGSDRIAHAVQNIPADLVVNVQGDEPFIHTESLRNLVQIMEEDTQQLIDLASLMTPISAPEEILNPNNVKVVTDKNHFALYFSRSPIPFSRDGLYNFPYMKHIGVYAFRKKALMDFAQLPTSPAENCEKLEQLRYLENGKRIKMVLTHKHSVGIDTPEDLAHARKIWQQTDF